MNDHLQIANKYFHSRLILGTGKYRSTKQMIKAIESSGTEMVTVAIRRLDLKNPNKKNILDAINWEKYRILPNTAGCKTAEEAIYIAQLAREITGSNWVKLEVIPDTEYLLPDPIQTYKAAKELVNDGFIVLPYINADPILAQKLESIGCATVMPLGSAIGSGQGIKTYELIKIIIAQASVPVIIDAGLGVPSEASQALELGADAVLVNTAIAQANNPELMAQSFKMGVIAGRKAFLAGRIPQRTKALPSSPIKGISSINKN